MATIATEHRAQLLTAVALLLIAAAPWHRTTPASAPRKPVTVSIEEPRAELEICPPGPLSIDIPGIDPVDLPNAAGSLAHPDMRPWPTGMVIGARLCGDRNNLRRTSVWDSLLSALLAPFRSQSV